MATQNFKVVVYGADLPGVFAAAKAAAGLTSGAANGKVALIVPYPKTRYYDESSKTWKEDYLLGGIMTAGGLNYWDDSYYSNESLTPGKIQQGSYYWYRTDLGMGFNRIKLSDKCKASMTNGNVTIFYGQDIYSYTTANSPFRISSVTVSPIHRDSSGRVVWTNTATQTTLNATIFIDASVDGRIVRTVNSSCTTGRYSWPAKYLSNDEKPTNSEFVGRQQAATLMIKMRNIVPRLEDNGKKCYGCNTGDTVSAELWADEAPYTDASGPVAAFNNRYKDTMGIMIKPVNAARNGCGYKNGGAHSDDWWVNGLLIFNVDGRSHYRDDAANTVFKVNRHFNSMTTDDAWLKARNFVRSHVSELETAFRSIPGLENASIVKDDAGYPVVGDQLYIRETVHGSTNSANRAHGTSNSNYRVTQLAAQYAGSSTNNGEDRGYYATRIGLGFYYCDIYPYEPSDCMKKVNGVSTNEYIWKQDLWNQMWAGADNPKEPMYIPYYTLTTQYVANLLIPGYGASICSYSWGELRVFSNLSVLGDAAGITAAYCCNHNVNPFNLHNNATAIKAIQDSIKAAHGRIDK